MRRILLGGLGIALGAFAQPALAQQPTSQPPPRAAAFGRPCAVPDSPTPGAVTPAAAFTTGPAQSTVAYAPGTFGTPTPVIVQPPGAPTAGTVPWTGPVPTVQPWASTQTAPPSSGGPPMVTETRDPTGRIPSGTVVPSVAPDGFVCPDLGLDDPLYGEGRPGAADRFYGGRNWVGAELLMWWNRSTQVPALVTTSSPQYNGIVGQGDTRVLLGGSFGDTYHVGGRISAGHWFDDCELRGVDVRLFWVAPSTATFSASDPPYTLLARPFVNTNPGTASTVGLGQTSEVVAGPGVATGNVVAQLKSTVWGADIDYRRYLLGTPQARLDLLVGYRYLDLHETLTVSESFDRIPGSNLGVGVPAQSGTVTDQFRTENQFHGGQVGLVGTVERGRWSLEARSSIAFGTVFQTAEINGGQVLVFPNGTVQTAQGGLLAVPGANIGRYSQARFAVLPEVGLNLGYNITPRLKVFFGYNFLYLSSALRPGGVIDTNIDAARVPNLLPAGSAAPTAAIHPTVPMTTSGYFVQGISFGVSYRW
jgi:hypothetical protein